MTEMQNGDVEEANTTNDARTGTRTRRSVLYGVGGIGVFGLFGQTAPAEASQSTSGWNSHGRDRWKTAADGMPDGLFQQVQKLLADDGGEFDFFGFSVALTEDTALIGATGDGETGSVYVFVRRNGRWTQTQKLLPKDTDDFNEFGFSVALTEETALIGAPLDDGNATDSGAVYVFSRRDGRFTQTQKLVAGDGDEFDSFGFSVALTEDTALIGATGDDENGEEAGAAYVFSRQNSGWEQTQKLLASDGGESDSFGSSVALTEDTVLVSAPFDDQSGTDAGSVYLFTRRTGRWIQTQELLAGDGAEGDQFGRSIDLVEDTALIGAPGDSEGDGFALGSAYVFMRQNGQWTQSQKLIADDGDADDFFGDSVALTEDTALIGAVGDEENDDLSGSAYVFARRKKQWTQTQKLLAEDGDGFDFFGDSVALAGETALIGAYLDEESGMESGSAYVFERTAGDQCPAGLDIVFRYLYGGWRPDTCDKNGEKVNPNVFSIKGNRSNVTVCAAFPFAVRYATRKRNSRNEGGRNGREDDGKREKTEFYKVPNSGGRIGEYRERDAVLAEPVDGEYRATISSGDDGNCTQRDAEICWFRVYCPDDTGGH